MSTKFIAPTVRAMAALFLLPAIVSAQPSVDAPADPARSTETQIREQTVYIPYSKLRDSFERKGRGVFLPYDKFQEMWKAARGGRQPKEDDGPPVGALIAEIKNDATIKKDVVTVAATIQIELLKEGWHQVPLGLADAAITSARIKDDPARILSSGRGGYELLVKKEGKAPEQIILSLEYSKAYTKSPGQNSISIQSPQAPVNRWRIRIPEAGVKVNVHPIIAASEVPKNETADSGDPVTEVLAFVGAAPTVRVDWTPKVEGAAGLEALATAHAEQQVTVDEGAMRTRTTLAYNISRADLARLRVEVPGDQKVAALHDPNVRQWEIEKKDDKQLITIQLFQPARGTQNITLELEKFGGEFDRKQFEVPVVTALDAGRQQGVVVIRLGEGLRGEPTAPSGLLQMDTSELPRSLSRGKWEFAYRYAALPFHLDLNVEKILPRVQADQLVEAYLEPEKLTLDLLAMYDITRAGIFRFTIDIPKGVEVRRVEGKKLPGTQAALVDDYHVEGDDKTRLVVNLASKAIGKVGLFVELERRLDDANLLSPTGKTSELPLPFPTVAPGSVQRTTGRLVICKPESLRINPEKQDGLRSISFADAYRDLPTCRDERFTAVKPSLAFAFTDQPPGLELKAERRKPHVTVRQLLVSRFDTGQVKYEARFNYSIRYSGVKTLRIDVPASLAGDIRNDTPQLRESNIEPVPDDVPDGYVAWGFTGDTEFTGDVAIRLAWEQKIDDMEVGKPVTVSVPVLRPGQVDRSWGQIVVAKSETLEIQPDVDSGLRPIDPQHDLSAADRVAGAARGFEFQEDWSLSLRATRYKLEDLKRTSIELAVVREVVTRSGQVSIQALYRMRSARQGIAIDLPPGLDPAQGFDAQPLRINGQPVPLEKGSADQYYVPLVGQDPNRPFLLELRYTLPGSADNLELPEFPNEPAVQKVYLCAFLPNDLTVVGSRGPWTDEQPPWWQNLSGNYHRHHKTLVGDVMRGCSISGNPADDFETDGRLYVYSTLRPQSGTAADLSLVTMNQNWFQGIVFALVALAGAVLLNRSISQKFTALALLCIALIMAGVFLPTLSGQIIQSVFFWAVSIVLIVWIVWFVLHDLPRYRAALASVRAAPKSAPPATPPPIPPVSPRGKPTAPPTSDLPESAKSSPNEPEGDEKAKQQDSMPEQQDGLPEQQDGASGEEGGERDE